MKERRPILVLSKFKFYRNKRRIHEEASCTAWSEGPSQTRPPPSPTPRIPCSPTSRTGMDHFQTAKEEMESPEVEVEEKGSVEVEEKESSEGEVEEKGSPSKEE